MTVDVVVSAAIVGVLVFVIMDDVRNYRIKNSAIITLFCLIIFQFLIEADLHYFLAHAAFSTIAFAVLMVAFRRRLFGGGDAKLLTIAFLAIGPERALVYAICLLLLSVIYWGGAKVNILPSQLIGTQLKIPFGPSIGGAWIATIFFFAVQQHG